jgi:threonine synthase
MRVTGWRCAVCAAEVDIATSFPWRCPNATAHDRRHVLQIVNDESPDGRVLVPGDPGSGNHDDVNPFLRHDADLAWAAHADANGIGLAARRRLVTELDDAVRGVAGVGFVPTPFGRSDALSDALGFTDGGGVWVKDETGGVGGSQKARHLFTILLHLRATEILGHLTERPPLAIASCGNAALAAATLARAADWPIDVYVPTWMSDGFGVELDRLGARVHRCERRASDPAGDPAMFRFREAVAAGAIPFTVQGPENALALDGGRTLGWEIGEQLAEQRAGELDRMFVQVGGGAFAACVGVGLHDIVEGVRLIAVQAEGCAPLVRAWQLAEGDGRLGSGRPGRGEPVGARWAELMTPWPDPHSLADGILDDETYDWLGVFDAIGASGDAPIVAAEADIVAAHELARSAGFDVSPTGSAGLAGLLAIADTIGPTERVAVVMSGVAR